MSAGAATTAGGRPHHPEGGEAMPITITLHILGYTVTIRDSARFPGYNKN